MLVDMDKITDPETVDSPEHDACNGIAEECRGAQGNGRRKDDSYQGQNLAPQHIGDGQRNYERKGKYQGQGRHDELLRQHLFRPCLELTHQEQVDEYEDNDKNHKRDCRREKQVYECQYSFHMLSSFPLASQLNATQTNSSTHLFTITYNKTEL